MITMDLKGITWMGHVYQKFEAMCLEVEEVMYQDTVKYVENQVQTVGASVKKFYSDVMQDVMQDLLLPSSLEPVKTVAASDIPVEKHAGTLKRSNVCLREDAVKGDGEQLTEDSEVIADFDENAVHVSSTSQHHAAVNVFESCSGNSVERASSDLLSGENSNWTTLNKMNVENLHMAEKSSEAASLENDFSQDMSSFCGNANANHEMSGHQIPATLTPASVPGDNVENLPLAEKSLEAASLENDFSRDMSSFCGNANANHEMSGHQIPSTLTLASVPDDNVENLPMAEKSSEAASLENDLSRDMSSFCGDANANHEMSGHQIPATLTPASVPDDNVENLPLAEKSSEAPSLENDFSQDMSSFCGNANANHEMSGHQIPATLTPASVPDDCDSIEEGCNEIESASCSILEISTDGLHLIDSIGKKEVEKRSSPSLARSAGSNDGSSNTGMVNFVRCSGNDDIQHKEFSNKINFASCPGQSNNLTMDNSGNSTVAQKEIETVQQLDKTRVDESCILVNEAELYFHPQREGQHKPYKKKIRDAISSRMRSARKKEYERLALWYGDDLKSDQDCEGSSMSAIRKEDTRKSLTHDVMDSEWELL